MPHPHNLSGRRFGRLIAEVYVGKARWRCRCDCGGSAIVISSHLKSGHTISCGCKRHETTTKHGMAGTPVYHAWQQLFQRCENPRDRAYHNYGGRGITVCEEWRDFSRFLADMGMRPAGFQLDREDNDKGYCKENCRWVTAKVNRNNQRNNRRVTYLGRTQTVPQWAEEVGLHCRTLHNRLSRGWTVEQALTEPNTRKR